MVRFMNLLLEVQIKVRPRPEFFTRPARQLDRVISILK